MISWPTCSLNIEPKYSPCLCLIWSSQWSLQRRHPFSSCGCSAVYQTISPLLGIRLFSVESYRNMLWLVKDTGKTELQKGSLCSPPGRPADVCAGSPYAGCTEGSVLPPHPSLQRWMFWPCGIRQGPSPPLRRTPRGQHAALLSSLVLTTFFHKSPVHTSHFWIAGFPLRTQTISLWYNRLYFYINVSSWCEIYCLAGPIRLRRSSTVLRASQPSELHHLLKQLIPMCRSAKRELFRGWVWWIFRRLGDKKMLPPWNPQQARSLASKGLLFKGFARIL